MDQENLLNLNFRRLTKNPFFRAKLLDSSDGKCAQCGIGLSPAEKNWVVHHLTYDHSCIYPDLVKVEVKRIRRGKEKIGKIHTTQCESCFSLNIEVFLECQKRVVPLCSRCHFLEHKADIIEYKVKKALGKDFDKCIIRARVNARYNDKKK